MPQYNDSIHALSDKKYIDIQMELETAMNKGEQYCIVDIKSPLRVYKNALIKMQAKGFFVSSIMKGEIWPFVVVSIKRPKVKKWFRYVLAPEMQVKQWEKLERRQWFQF